MAGMVTPAPKAMPSPALPVVWTMLFSRMVARRTPNAREKARNSVMERTATGIEAETVIPTLSTRYIELAPKRIPRAAPTTTGSQVSSAGDWFAGTKGLCSDSPGVSAGGRRVAGAGRGSAMAVSLVRVRRESVALTGAAV